MSFSVVIPTVGRPSLGVLLAALRAGSGPSGPWPDEAVVVDDRRVPDPALDVPPWVRVVRSGGRGPSALSHIILNALGAMLVLEVAKRVVVAADGPTVTMLVLLGIFLPALIYVFLASLWVLKMVRSAMPR